MTDSSRCAVGLSQGGGGEGQQPQLSAHPSPSTQRCSIAPPDGTYLHTLLSRELRCVVLCCVGAIEGPVEGGAHRRPQLCITCRHLSRPSPLPTLAPPLPLLPYCSGAARRGRPRLRRRAHRGGRRAGGAQPGRGRQEHRPALELLRAGGCWGVGCAVLCCAGCLGGQGDELNSGARSHGERSPTDWHALSIKQQSALLQLEELDVSYVASLADGLRAKAVSLDIVRLELPGALAGWLLPSVFRPAHPRAGLQRQQ